MMGFEKKTIFARIRQMNEKYTWIFAGGYSVAFFAVLILFHCNPSMANDALEGRLIDGEFIILNWAFGSSVGSRMKDSLIAANPDKKE